MPLREYQVDLVNRVSKSWRTAHKAPCIVLPCGGGKSVIVAEMAKRTTKQGKQVLFLVHRKELCEQIESTFRWWGVDMRYCKIMMVQTACRRIDKIKEPVLIITDENHHCLANSYRKIYDAFPNAYKVGVTATPIRLDGSGLGDVNDDLIVGVSAKWLIDNRCLSPYKYYSPKLADLEGIKIKRGEYDANSVAGAFIKKAIFGDVIQYYNRLANGMQAICYCPTVNYSKLMAEKFTESGIKSEHIDGNTPKEERNRIIECFRNGTIQILCNVDLISEGFDVPDCSCVIMLRPTKSLTLYIQQSMRCMRYKQGKQAVIIDHVGNYARHGMPDQDRQWNLKPKKKSSEGLEDDISDHLTTCENCFATFTTYDENGEKRLFCPECGAELPQKHNKTEIDESKETELVEIVGFTVNTKTPDDCQSYKELLDYAKQHGYKPGWAYYKAKQRGLMR